jgi:hypothetical protein
MTGRLLTDRRKNPTFHAESPSADPGAERQSEIAGVLKGHPGCRGLGFRPLGHITQRGATEIGTGAWS